ncbi:hypothetical protein RCL_jg22465.t1 [Rhizophagus clarus]|uniref:Uncharacterized protein n=1 Tax=Rhizophagus clarus TaxID=94130 RepID=A0A8H3MIQ5_9GLOM|nr:hypothetical protein RCL_jg22465.t1 [Rhizophagus clarus]
MIYAPCVIIVDFEADNRRYGSHRYSDICPEFSYNLSQTFYNGYSEWINGIDFCSTQFEIFPTLMTIVIWKQCHFFKITKSWQVLKFFRGNSRINVKKIIDELKILGKYSTS